MTDNQTYPTLDQASQQPLMQQPGQPMMQQQPVQPMMQQHQTAGQPMMQQQPMMMQQQPGQPMMQQPMMMQQPGQPMMQQQQPGQPMMQYQQPMMQYQQPMYMQQPAGGILGTNCCGCIPIKMGLRVLGVFAILSAVSWMFTFISHMANSYRIRFELFIPLIVCLLAEIAGAGMFIFWFVKDNAMSRKLLPAVFLIHIITSMTNNIVFMVRGVFLDLNQVIDPWTVRDIAIPFGIVGIIIQIIVNSYWAFVVRKYDNLLKTFA